MLSHGSHDSMICFLATDISATEKNIFSTKQSLKASVHAVVAVLITVPDSCHGIWSSHNDFLQFFLVLWFVMHYDTLNKTNNCYILVSATYESLMSIFADAQIIF